MLPIVVTVRVEVVPAPMAAGLNEAPPPAGSPLMLKAIVSANPFMAPAATVYVAALPDGTVRESGVAAIVKSGPGTDTGKIWTPFTGARGPPTRARCG